MPEVADFDLSDRTGIAVGWGATAITYQHTTCGYKRAVTNYDSAANVLQVLNDLRLVFSPAHPVYIITLHIRFETLGNCNQTFYDLYDVGCPIGKVSSVNLCATSPSGDICQGDSGGGLVTIDRSLR